jgi:parvulin-like peptidyl-prolyl isomerase
MSGQGRPARSSVQESLNVAHHSNILRSKTKVLRKHKRNLSLIAVVLGALLIAACGSGGSTTPDNTVAATVNGKKIMLSEVERLIQQQTQGKQADLSTHALAQARLQVLDNLIQREVLFQRAEQEKLLPSEDEITNVINKQKQDSGMTDEEFARRLKDQNMRMEVLREDSKRDLAIQKLQDKYAGKITISDREVEDYYNANKQAFVLGKGVELADIVVDPQDNGLQDDAKTEADAKLKIDGIYQQLKSVGTERFGEVALAKSEDQTRMNGGDIGFLSEDALKRNNFPAALVTRLFAMQPGEFTDPVQFNGRWYIFKLKRKQLEVENRTLESPGVRQQITVELTDQRKQILNAALLVVALSEAKVVNNLAADILTNPSNLGLRPASSNATKPASSPAATTASPSPAAKASASPAKGSSPAK